MKNFRYLAQLLGFVVCAPSLASAASILDQSFDPGNFHSLGSSIGLVDKAQTFTVGLEGILTRIDVKLGNDNDNADTPLLFELRATINGVPKNDDMDVLAALQIPIASIPKYYGIPTNDWLTVDISAFGVEVMPADVLAIVLRTEEGSNPYSYGWGGDIGNLYEDGLHYFRNPAAGILTWSITGLDHDAGFRTFVEVTAVPLPPTSWLFISALFSLKFLGKKRNSGTIRRFRNWVHCGRRRGPRAANLALKAIPHCARSSAVSCNGVPAQCGSL